MPNVELLDLCILVAFLDWYYHSVTNISSHSYTILNTNTNIYNIYKVGSTIELPTTFTNLQKEEAAFKPKIWLDV